MGFRYKAREIARNYDVAGYVQNLADGRVLLVAEGEPEQLEALVRSVLEAMADYVREHTVTKSPATGGVRRAGSG